MTVRGPSPDSGRAGGDRLPSFIVIGAMKGGSTSLYHYLRDHDEVFMAKVKELDFFTGEANWSRGLSWYEHHFSGSDGALARGEASTAYTKYPHYRGVPERMASVVPDVRLVYVVRHPIERIRSHYQHRVALGAEQAPADVAVLENPIYVDYSRYSLQLEQYLDHFPPEHMLVLTSEDLRDDRRSTMARVYSFIGVDPAIEPPELDTEYYRTDTRRAHGPLAHATRRHLKRWIPQAKRAKEFVDTFAARPRRDDPAALGDRSRPAPVDPLSPGTRARLADLLADDVSRLRSRLGPDFDHWNLP